MLKTDLVTSQFLDFSVFILGVSSLELIKSIHHLFVKYQNDLVNAK